MAAVNNTWESWTVDDAARRSLRGLATGERLSPMLRRLLMDALTNEDRSDRPHDPAALVSSAARAATEWIGTDFRQREKVVRDLLEFSDALPPQPKAGPSLPDKISSIHAALKEVQIAHAFGGALAVGFYGEPRATRDIDLNVFVPSADWSDLSDLFSSLKIDIEDGEGNSKIDERQLDWGSTPVHLFFSSDDLHDEMERKVRLAPFGGDTIPLVAPEHLMVRKAVLGPPKDWLDIEQILVATDPLDLREIEDWLERMVGGDNPRMEKLREVKAGLSVD
ncbi:MAG TPA: hypothetical protein VLC07_04285 [Solirubrobacterales bacterium]|nr:hypothetical protein [Solirubrobacterales bacterium]